MSDIVVLGWVFTTLTMILHVAGTVAGWWSAEFWTWLFPLFGVALMLLGGIHD